MVLLVTAYIRERLHSHWLENRHLIEELTQKERSLKKKDAQLSTWGELSHALIANFDLPRLLDLIVTTAMEVTDAERGSVMLLDTEENVLTIKAAKGMDEEWSERPACASARGSPAASPSPASPCSFTERRRTSSSTQCASVMTRSAPPSRCRYASRTE